MDWNEIWKWSQSGIVVLISWGIKEIVSLKVHQWKESEKYRLDREKLEHEVRFKKLYDQVSANLIDLFAKLASLRTGMRKFTPDPTFSLSSDSPKTEVFAKVSEAYNQAFNFLTENRLLFPIPIFQASSAYLQGVKGIILRTTSAYRAEQNGITRNHDYWEKATKDFDAMEPQYNAIHKAMQEFLGLS